MSFNRKPLNQGCAPTSPAAPDYIEDECAYLPYLKAELYRLMTGQATSEARHGDFWKKTHNGSVVELKREIQRLELKCTPGANHALALGPRFNPTANGFGRRHSRY